MADTKNTTEFKKYHNPILPAKVVEARLDCRADKVSDAKTVVTADGPVAMDEKWKMVMYYQYDDGKTEVLHTEYNALPCYIVKDTKGKFGAKRKIYAKIDRARRMVHDSVIELGNMCKRKFMEAFFTKDCSKVFGAACKVSVVHNNAPKEVSYPDFIQAVLAKKSDVMVGKTKIALEKVQEAFEVKLLGYTPEEEEDKDPIESMVRMDNFISIPSKPEMSPTKYIDITGYPKQAKSDSKEDQEKYEIGKVQGSRILRIWCDANLRGRLLQEKLLPEAGWIQSAKGTTYYTSDYHIMTHIAKGNTPMIALCSTISFRPSIGKEGDRAGVYSIVVEENFTQGSLADIRPSEYEAKSSAAVAAYEEEYVNGGRTQAPQATGGMLQRLADQGQVGEVEIGEEHTD
jgi:hypothetical protein